MKKHFLILSLLSTILVLSACKKELSFENGGTPSEGSLTSDVSGDCLPKTVVGTYEEGVALVGTANYLEIQVDVTSAGSYVITSDTINGIWFKASGVFTATGLTTLKLSGSGTPFAEGIQNFVISYDTSQCVVAVTTLPVGAGVPAEFTLTGSPNACSVVQLVGTYIADEATDATHYVVLNINVTQIGTYTITTNMSNGLVFSGSGTLGTTGAQTIQLAAQGTPVTAGSTNIPVTAGTSVCSFDVPVVDAADYVMQCGTATVTGTYTSGVALTSTNTIEIDVLVNTVGPYSISGTVNDMSFTAAGTFTATGTQTLTLAGSGTAGAEGDVDLTLTGGTATCVVTITVEPGSGSSLGTWQFTQGATTFTGTFDDVQVDNTSLAPYTIYGMSGLSSTGNYFDLGIVDIASPVQNGETYTCAPFTSATNYAVLYLYDTIDDIYAADLTISDNTVIVTVTNHNTATKTITGTFSGKAEAADNVLVDITNGQFTATYP